MQGDPGHAEAPIVPGDLINTYGDRVLIIASRRANGFIGINAWHVTCLSGRGIRDVILHDETRTHTWCKV